MAKRKLAEKMRNLAVQAHNMAEKARQIADEKNRLVEAELKMKEEAEKQKAYDSLWDAITTRIVHDADKGKYENDYDAGNDEEITIKVVSQLREEGFKVEMSEKEEYDDPYDREADDRDEYILTVSWEKPKK
jgi:DNA-binding helix-hairpin-helix protein with protein kinase domain